MRTLHVVCFLCGFCYVFQAANSQLINSVSARCSQPALYLYGTCRYASHCPAGETALLGNSYCNLYATLLGRTVTRCVKSLPCCVYGGVCRDECQTGETTLTVANDCQFSCCFTLSPYGTPTPPTTPAMTVAQRQGPCGSGVAIQSRIIGGAPAAPTDWPWMVRFLFRNSVRGACSGVLVDDDTVLTVAHCVYGVSFSDIRVSVGDNDLTRYDEGQRVVGVANVVVADGYVFGVRGKDLAVVKLSQSATPFTSTLLPACLLDTTIPLATNTECFVAGWGVTETGQESHQLRAAQVVLISARLCNDILLAVSGNNQALPSTDVTCTDTAATGTDACLFDDGGMLSCLDADGRYSLVGLVSEYSCGNLPTVYTSLTNFTDFILDNL